MGEQEPLVPIREAAKAIGRGREYVRRLIDDGHVRAYIGGGSAKSPWLWVRVSELRRAVEAHSIYRPKNVKPAAAKERRPRTPFVPNPGAAPMLERE